MKARTLFFILVLLNAGLAAVLFWSLQQPVAPQAVPPDEHAGLVLLQGETAASLAQAQPASAAVAEPVAEPEPVASAPAASDAGGAGSAPVASVASVAAEVPAERRICMRWGDFTTTQWREARASLRLQFASVEIEEFLNEDKARYWVYLPPFDTQEQARAAVADLKARGVGDTFIIQEPGPQQLAVSLGLFSKKSMAEEFVARLKAKGIERIISKPHPQSRYISIVLREVPEDQKAALRALAGRFEKTALQVQACPR